MRTQIRAIGAYGRAGQAHIDRNLAGMLCHCVEFGGFKVRDFRTPERIATLMADKRHRPPWQGLVDGVVVSTGRDATMSDKQVADWLLRAARRW